jgi:hypothetical protein
MRKITTALLIASICSISYAEDTATDQAPKTKLEAFQAKTGTVIVKGYSEIGSINGIGGSVSITAREFLDATNPAAKTTGVVIEVSESGRLQRVNRSLIDSDEIASLLKGIDYISGITGSVTKQSSFEADYRTKGDFKITVFNTKQGIEAAVSAGMIGKTTVYLKLEDLQKLKSLIIQAKEKL